MDDEIEEAILVRVPRLRVDSDRLGALLQLPRDELSNILQGMDVNQRRMYIQEINKRYIMAKLAQQRPDLATQLPASDASRKERMC